MSFNFTTKSVRSLFEKRSSSLSPGKRKTYGIKFVQCDTVAIFFCFILIHFKEKVLRGDYPTRWNHVSKICKAVSFALHEIGTLRQFLSQAATENLVHALIMPRIDFCNSLLYGLSDMQISKLQRIKTSAARLVQTHFSSPTHLPCSAGITLATGIKNKGLNSRFFS